MTRHTLDLPRSSFLTGTLAAKIQRKIYGGNTGGIFSVAQSLAATQSVNAAPIIAGAALIAAGTIYAAQTEEWRRVAAAEGGNDEKLKAKL